MWGYCSSREAMDVYPLSVSGPASAMLLAMGMTPILLLGRFISTVVCIVLHGSSLRNLRLQACHYVASLAKHRSRALARVVYIANQRVCLQAPAASEDLVACEIFSGEGWVARSFRVGLRCNARKTKAKPGIYVLLVAKVTSGSERHLTSRLW